MSDRLTPNGMRHSNIPLAKWTGDRKHPYVNKENHDSLLEYLTQRLQVGKKNRDGEIKRLVRVDKKFAGWIKLKDEDVRRVNRAEETGEPLVTHLNLPLTFVHIDDMMTYLAQTFSPNRGMFYNTGAPEEQDEAKQLVVKMNNDAIQTGYFREILAGLFDCLKYNMGGFHLAWGSETGPTLTVNTDDSRTIDTGQVKWEGNRMEALNRYNLLIDPSVHPSKLHLEGEFGGFVRLRSHYWIQQRASRGAFYNCEEALKSGGDMRCEYYLSPPREARLEGGDHSRSTDWVGILSERPDGMQDGHEVIQIYCRLNPTEFGLVEAKDKKARSRYELWRFYILDGKWIVNAQWMDNVHDHIPMYFGLVHDDAMSVAQKSPAELLIPLQDFASFLLNTHMEASRSAIYGGTFYDPTMVKLDKIPKGEVAWRLPVEPKAYGKDIRSFVWANQSNVDTGNTMQDLQIVMQLIDQFFPTQSLPSQIASIDRAVDSQVAAVQQGANRRQQKTARLLDDSMFRPIRYAMYYNIIQYQSDGESITDFYSGKQVQIDLTKLKDTNLPFIIGQGLKAIDRMATAQMIQQVIFALIQAPAAGQQFDLAGMIDFWTDMLDIDMDMKQFRVQMTPAPGQPAEGAPTGNPIVPANNPASITQPIHG